MASCAKFTTRRGRVVGPGSTTFHLQCRSEICLETESQQDLQHVGVMMTPFPALAVPLALIVLGAVDVCAQGTPAVTAGMYGHSTGWVYNADTYRNSNPKCKEWAVKNEFGCGTPGPDEKRYCYAYAVRPLI